MGRKQGSANLRFDTAKLLRTIALAFPLLFIPMFASAQDFIAKALGDYGNVTVMETTGNYDSRNPDGTANSAPREAIAKEFFKTHKDDYDFLVVFSNFNYQMPNGEAQAFYLGVKNDTAGIGKELFDYTGLFGSAGSLQGMIDMGNVANLTIDPLDPKFEDTLQLLSHEMLHRWGAYVQFKDASGALSKALLGSGNEHWSYLLGSTSVLYGNQWQDNGNNTFTSLGEGKNYSPLDLYLMGLAGRDNVPPLLLIDNQSIDPAQRPHAGVTISGTARTVTIDDIIAAMGSRVPDASVSPKSFKTAFIFITQPGTFRGDEVYGIENIRNGAVTRFSALADGQAVMQIASTLQDNIPVNPGVLPPSLTPRTLPPNINDGVQWLMNNQRSDGSWMDYAQTPERDTAESVRLLKSFASAQQSFQSGLAWLTGNASDNADYLAKKIETLAVAGQDVSTLAQNLTSLQNSDGGWGKGKNYWSNPTDTALALKALSSVSYTDMLIISKAIGYLKSQQNTDGGWGSEDKGGMVRETSNVLSAFNKYRTAYQLDDALSRGTTWLIGKQNVDGGFGNSPSTVYDTAVATITLRELNASTDITNKALTYLPGRQSENGSWNNSAFETALAVEAIYKATVDPDLAVKSDDITIIPDTIKSLPSNIVISANISNVGQTGAQAKVVLYEGSIADQNKIGEQTLAFPGQSTTTVTFSATARDGSEHRFYLVVDPDNVVKESNELNNTALKILYPEATYDFEVLSSDITVSANPINMLQDVNVSTKITNKGTMNAYNVQVKYYIDDPVAPFELATQTVDIPAGATITNQTTWRANKAGVNMLLTVMVDPFNNFAELSETNNKASTPITVNGATAPNLSVSYKDMVITPSPASQGGNATITAVVKNDGFSAASNVQVNFFEGVPGADGVLIGNRIIPFLNPGDAGQASVNWANISDSGEKIVYVKVDPDNQIIEIRKDDNDAFTTLTILSLPDFAVSSNSIVFSPAAPKDGDRVVVTVTVQNRGEQASSNTVVRFSEGAAVLGDRTIASLAGNSTGTVSLSYDTAGKKGSHTITAIVDPDNAIAEQSKDNNSASKTFGVQDANFWVTEPYFSPNGDGVKDSTQFFFSLDVPKTVTVSVLNKKAETVRTFSGPEMSNVSAGTVTWDGLDNSGMAVADGEYQLQLRDASVSVLGSLPVTVDTNRSPLTDALGTKYLLNNNMTCELPYLWPEDWDWLAYDSGVVFTIPSDDSSTPDYPAGIYTMAPNGEDIVRIVPREWTGANPLYAYSGFMHRLSPDREKVAFTFWKSDNNTRTATTELWITDTDGRNLTLLEASDLNYSLDDMKWSPDGNYLAYTRYQYTGYLQLWIININTMVKTRIDSGALYYPNIEWSPDGSELAYIATNRSFVDALRKSDRLGNKSTIFTFGNNADKEIYWLENRMMVSRDRYGALWLFDMSGSGNHVHLSDYANEVALAPNRLSFAFAASAGSTASLYISDTTGNADVVHEFQNAALTYGPQLRNIIWSADGGKIAFIEAEKICVDCSGTPSSFVPNLTILDRKTGNKTSHAVPVPFLVFKSWLSDDISLAGGVENTIYVMNTATGEITPLVSEVRIPGEMTNLVSPLERYLTYEKPADQSSVCYSKGYVDLWSLSSLRNLTAELTAAKEKSAIILKGIAADLNFEGYQLDYADIKSPEAWTFVQPPSNAPIGNDVFTAWVPPYEGTFYVRLTAWDKAGNTAASRKRVSWGQYSSITNLYKSTEIFSPNGDGVKDTVELHYRVQEPVHVEFNIYDDNDKLVRTFLKDYTGPLDDFITWDGKDESGNAVPDGKYKIKVFDNEFFVEVDNTPPDVRINFKGIEQDPDGGTLYAGLQGHAVDNKFKNWVLEYGEGDNPQEWNEYSRGQSQIAGTDDKGNSIPNPVRDASVASFAEGSVAWLANKKFRITAEDYAGNKSTAVANFIEEKIIINRHWWNDPSDPLLYSVGGNGSEVFLLPPPARLYPELLVPHPHGLGGLETIRTPIANMNVQYYSSDHKWVDFSTVVNSSPGYISLGWDPSGIKQQFSAVRVRAVDTLGQEYYSNIILTQEVFSIDTCAMDPATWAPLAMNILFEELKLLKFQTDGTDIRVFDSTKGDTIPTGVFDFSGSGINVDLPPTAKHTLKMVGVGISGKEYDSNEATYPPNNCKNSSAVSLELKVTPAETDCGVVSGKAELTAELKEIGGFLLSLKTVSYYLQKSDGLQLLQRFDASKGDMGSLTIDTSTMPERSYPVKAVLSYLDESDNTAKEIAASNVLIVDRVLPAAQITYPTKSSVLCPVKTSEANGEWYGLGIEGIATDNNAVNYYELYYGVGESPAVWLPAMTRNNGKSVPISGKGNLQGRFGVWDVTELHGTIYSLKLKVVDVAGNVSCHTTSFSISTLPEIVNLAIDVNLISPNGDGVLDAVHGGYAIDEYATLSEIVFRLAQAAGGSFVPDGAPVRTIVAGQQHLGGSENIFWDGKKDNGDAVADGKYGVTVLATDSCGNTAAKWVAVEADNTPPTTSISYPQPGAPLGNVVEIKGNVFDLHFQSYTLEAGQGESPDAWTTISTGTSPVTDSVLGIWNTFGLNGRWTLRLSARDSAGNRNTTTVLIDLGTRQNLIKSLSATPTLFSPNKDGKLDTATIQYELTDTCDTKIDIIDTNSVVRKTISASTMPAGLQAQPWDGTDDAGAALVDGSYALRLTAVLSSTPEVNEVETITTTLDTTPPAIDMSQPLNNSYVRNNITVAGSVTDTRLSEYAIVLTGPAGTVQVDQGTQPRNSYAFGILNDLPDGAYTLNVKTKDLGENVTEKNIAFTVDKTAPVVTIDVSENGGYYGGDNAVVNITGGIVEQNLNMFALRYGLGDSPSQWTSLMNGATIPAVQPMFSWNVGPNDGVLDGVYTLSLLVTDNAGSSAEAKAKITIDNTAPTASITAPMDGAVIFAATDVKGTAFDRNLDQYTVEISAGQCADAYQWAAIKTSQTSVQNDLLANWQALPPDGAYCVRVTTVDKSGNKAEATVNVRVDSHPPAPPVLSGTVMNRNAASLTWTGNDAQGLAGYNVYRNGQKINSAIVSDSLYLDPNLSEGIYAYTVTAVAAFGLEGKASNEVGVKIDLTGPDAHIRAPQDGARVSGLIDIRGTVYSADDFKQYRVSIGQDAAPTTWTLIRTSPLPVSYGVLSQWDTLGLGEGQVYSIKLEAEDLSGNITTHQISVTIDNTPPAGPLLISTAANSSDVTVTWQANREADLAGYLLYRNDQLANVSGIVIGNLQPYLIQGTTYVDKGVPDGTFRYYLMAMDQAGNISDQSNTLSVAIDTHPPQAAIVDPTDTSKFGGKIVVKAESPDQDMASVQFQYQSIQSSPTTTTDWLNLGSPVTSATPATYLDPSVLGLVYGDYRLRAVATDKGNKTDPAPGFITVSYGDLTPPPAPQGLGDLVSGSAVTLTWSANTDSDLAGYNVYRTSGSTRTKINTTLVKATPQPSYQDSGLADGTYAYDVTALDSSNNESKPSGPANAKIYAPVITQPYTPTGLNVIQVQGTNAGANAMVSISTGTASGIISTASADPSGIFAVNTALTLGENRIFATALDGAGNISEASGPVVVVYDVAPGAPSGAAASVNGSDIRLTWNPNPETAVLGYNLYRDGKKLNISGAAVNRTVTASSSFNRYQNGPTMAVDSAFDSFWMPQNGSSADNPSWWEMDLTAPELVNHVEIHWGTDVDASGNNIVYAGKDFEVQVWSGYAWITQTKVVGNAAEDNILDFKPSYRTDKIRIFITDSTDPNTAKQVRLAEISVIKDNLIPTNSQPSYDDLNLSDKAYGYTVTAVDNYGFESRPSGPVTASVSVASLGKPENLVVNATREGGLSASWTYSGNSAAGYYLYRSTVSGGPYSRVNDVLISGMSYLDTGLMSGIAYFYVVAAADGIGNEGVYSNEAFGTPLDAVPPSKPVIFFPATAGLPATLFSNTTDIYGSADPGSPVDLTGNAGFAGRTVAQSDDRIQSLPMDPNWYRAAISPDGKRLAYTTGDALWLQSLITGEVTRATQATEGYTLVWSPDSGKIAYAFSDSNWNSRISIYDINSGKTMQAPADVNAQEVSPSWSPDGSKVSFVRQWGTSPGVWIADLDAGTTARIISSDGVESAKLSPDGKRIAYFDNGNLNLFDLVDHASQLIDANSYAYAFEWSPDGKGLAFVSYRNGSGDVYVLTTDNGNQTLIPGSSHYPHNLAWTSDSRYVIFDLWDTTGNRDSLWMSDYRTQALPVRIMPDMRDVSYVGSTRVGTIAIINQGLSGINTIDLLSPKGIFTLNAVSLSPGENSFTARAADAAGNISDPSDAISVTFDARLMPDLSVSPDDVYLYPPYPIVGEQMAINAVVGNTGQVDVSNVDVVVYAWNALGQLELLKSETVPVIAAGSSELITATWDSTGKTGANRLVVVVDPEGKIAESNKSNNMAIKDFFVADHVGVSITTATDAAQYWGNQDTNITVTVWNTGPAANAVLNVRIEDANGNPVSIFDQRSINIAYGTQTAQNFVWNTGSTYAGSYIVHAVLKDAAGARLAEKTTPFTVIPDAAVDLSVATDKIAYGPGENVVTSFTIRNAGVNYIIPALQATVAITDAAGASAFSEVKNISNLMPGSSVDLSSSWNTGFAAPGDYHAVVTVSFDGGLTTTKTAAFPINSLLVLTGTITAQPSVVPVGAAAQLTYTIANAGNTDALGCTARVSIIDPETQTVIQTQDETVDLAGNSSKSGQVMVNTNGYGLKNYTAVLQSVYQGTVKNIANASFTVKDLTPPVVTVIAPAANGTYSSTVAISALAVDNASGVERVEYQVDSGTWKLLAAADPAQGRYSTTWNPTPAENGPHTVYFRATDKAGNIGTPAPVVFTIQMDTTPPVLTLSTLPDGAYTNNATLNITGTVTDDTAVQGVTINATAVTVNADGTFSQAISLTTGTNPIATIATDTAGNTAADARTIILDQSVPAITITSPADNSITNRISSTVTGTVDKTATVSVTANGISSDPSLVSDATFSFPVSLVYGQNTIQVTAIDLAGNTGTAKRTVTLDNQNPSLSVTYPAEDITTNQNQITLTGQVSDLTPVTVTVVVDGNVFTPEVMNGSFAQTITFTAQKTYPIKVTAVDEAGNQSLVQRNVIYNAIPQNFGVFGATGVSISGGYVDSYDSTRGAYDGVHGSNVSVGTNSAANRVINLSGGAAVYGDVYAGPGGDPAKAITTSGGAIIYGIDGVLSMLKDMTPVSDPGGGTPVSFKNGTTLTSGTYRVSSINLSGGGIGTIDGSVTLYMTGGLSLSGGAQIVILPGGSLTIYLGGKLNVSGGAIVNKTLDPHRLSIYGTATCSAANYSGNSAFYGVIYAPAAKTSISGGNVYGSVIGSSVTISGGAAVHYDESLGNI